MLNLLVLLMKNDLLLVLILLYPRITEKHSSQKGSWIFEELLQNGGLSPYIARDNAIYYNANQVSGVDWLMCCVGQERSTYYHFQDAMILHWIIVLNNIQNYISTFLSIRTPLYVNGLGKWATIINIKYCKEIL